MKEFQLSDINEVESRFKGHKHQSLKLSDSFGRLGFVDRSIKVEQCGTWLSFSHGSDQFGRIDPHGRLTYANFCKDRLCPMCNWRRSVKIFLEVSHIMDQIKDKYNFYFLSLTVPNVPGDQLSSTIRNMNQSFSRFMKKKWPKKLVKGYLKTCEITYQDDRSSKSYDTYHPHFHVLMALPKSYGKKIFFKKSYWLDWWREASHDDSIMIVDIEAVYYKNDAGSKVTQSQFTSVIEYKAAVCEATKYSVKLSEYLKKSPEEIDHIIFPLATQLTGFRFVSYGGCFSDARGELPDAEDGDLIHLDPADLLIPPSLQTIVNHFSWRIGCYVLCGEDTFLDRKVTKGLKLGRFNPQS